MFIRIQTKCGQYTFNTDEIITCNTFTKKDKYGFAGGEHYCIGVMLKGSGNKRNITIDYGAALTIYSEERNYGFGISAEQRRDEDFEKLMGYLEPIDL